MHGDGFGCLHTEDISGHTIEGLPFLRKNHPLSFCSRVVRLAFRPFAQKKGHFLAHVIFLLYLCSRKGFSVLSQSMEKLLLAQLK